MNSHNQALRLKELNFLRKIDTFSHITCLCTPKTFQYTKQTFIPLFGVKMTFIGILILAESKNIIFFYPIFLRNRHFSNFNKMAGKSRIRLLYSSK